MEKKQEEKWSCKLLKYDKDIKIDGFTKILKFTAYEQGSNKIRDIGIEISTRTSSCGSIQIGNMMIDNYMQDYTSIYLDEKQEKEILDTIKLEYFKRRDFNNFFFLDREGGNLESIFGKYFSLVHSYRNLNSGNIVNFWVYDNLTSKEVLDILEEEDDTELLEEEENF